jgi:hypothetical protein
MVDSNSTGYEVTALQGERIASEQLQNMPVASPALLLSQALDRLAALEERDHQREEEIAGLREENRALREEIALERAYDRQRLARLEKPGPALREETASQHLNTLFLEMRRLNLRQVRMKDAARILGLSVPQMKNVKPHIGDDPRFVIVKDPSHKQRHLIRLV